METEKRDDVALAASAEDSHGGDLASISQELEKSKQCIDELVKQKNASEAAFGQQRAKFMELYRQKEDELHLLREQVAAVNKLNSDLKNQLWQQSAELDDIKTAAAVSESSKLDEIENERRRCEEEIATVQQLVKEERSKWRIEEERLRTELTELRTKFNQDSDTFLGSITKTLQKKMGSGTFRDDHMENIDQDMKKAQEDAEMLRSVVQPLEAEIKQLRQQLKKAQRSHGGSPEHGASSGRADSEEKSCNVTELQENLDREKSSRTDLEMYVAVLNTQKGVLQEDLDKLRLQLRDVCQLLEEEKTRNASLKRIGSLLSERQQLDRLLAKDSLDRIQAVLTEEQHQVLTDSTVKNESLETKLREVELALKEEEAELERRKSLREQSPAVCNDGYASDQPKELPRSGSSTTFGDVSTVSVGPDAVASSNNSITSRQYNMLTNAQQKSLTAPSRESEASEALLTVAKMESLSAVGMRLVAEQEFIQLQNELMTAREAASRPCSQCSAALSRQTELEAKLASVEQTLQDEKQKCLELGKYIEELEYNLKIVANDASAQISALSNKLQESVGFVESARQQFVAEQKAVLNHLALSDKQRTALQRNLDDVRSENDILVAKRSKHAHELQEELINLPNTVEDMHLLLLNYREGLIAAKVAQERTSELLNGELELLRSQLTEEKLHARDEHDKLVEEIAQLQEQLAIQSSICTELEREKMETSAEVGDARLKQLIDSLRQQLQQQQTINRTLDQELRQLRAGYAGANVQQSRGNYPSAPQHPSWDSRHVFGQPPALSADECPKCRRRFSSGRLLKVHCQKCMLAHCSSCVNKTVQYAANQPQIHVCDTCYSMILGYQSTYR